MTQSGAACPAGPGETCAGRTAVWRVLPYLLLAAGVGLAVIIEARDPAARCSSTSGCAALAAAWTAVDVHAAPGAGASGRGGWRCSSPDWSCCSWSLVITGAAVRVLTLSPATSSRSRLPSGRGGCSAWSRCAIVAGTSQAGGRAPGRPPLGVAALPGRSSRQRGSCRGLTWFLVEQRRITNEPARQAAGRAERGQPQAGGHAGRERRPARAALAQAREAGIYDERQRMAREIHDTLAQGLTGIITQLQAAEQAVRRPGRAAAALRRGDRAGPRQPVRGPPVGARAAPRAAGDGRG